MPTPPREVLHAFGATGTPLPLEGGRGGTWRAGPVVLKPVDLAVESRWRAAVLDTVADGDRVRVARPVRAASGDWLHDGWEAWRYAPGRTDPRRCDAALDAAAAFHAAVAAVPRPDFLDERDDPWSRADRISWDLAATSDEATVRRLLAAREPVSAAAQLVHGDLLGNLLYEPGGPPTVIDWAPYWRPPSWAAAVAVVDAVCWHGAGADLVERWSHLPHWRQMLLRALLFRMLTDREREPRRRPHSAYLPAAAMILGECG